MHKLALAFSIAVVGLSANAVGQEAKSGGAYCVAGTALLMNDSMQETLKKVGAMCRPNDIIAIPPGAGGNDAIAQLCDFRQAIAVSNGTTYCAIVPARPLRNK
ncbi:hypothetical protein [Nitrospirillum bahiense]|uniref:hypothetical protein n=1 Tax=Nitrospirillum amazonense TaxID=28077 RepID=UPI00119ED5FC|nr:hypothetical protein [Nitrospirillum amazonense]